MNLEPTADQVDGSDMTREPAAPPLSVSAWIAFTTAGLFVFYQLVLQSLPSVIRSGLVVDFSLTDAGFGALSSSFYYPYMLLQIPAGLVVRRFGSRRVLLAGIVLCIVASFVTAASQAVHSVAAARVLMGLGASPTFVATMALVTSRFPSRLFPLLVALTETSGMLGAALGQEILGFVVQESGWRTAMELCAWFGIGVMFLIALFVRDAPRQAAGDVGEASRPAEGLLRRLLTPRLVLAALVGGMIYSAGLAFAMLWGVAFFERRLGVDLATASLCASFYSWGIIVGLPAFGWACGRWASPYALLAVGTLLTGGAVALILYAPPSLALSSVGMLACGFFSASYALAFVVVKNSSSPADSGAAFGLANMLVIAVGGLFLQPLIGVLARWHDRPVTDAESLSPLLWAQGVALILLIPLTWRARRQTHRAT